MSNPNDIEQASNAHSGDHATASSLHTPSRASSHSQHLREDKDSIRSKEAVTPGTLPQQENAQSAAPGGHGADEFMMPIVLSKKKFLPLYFGMILSLIVYSLDNTIVATAQVPIVESLGGENLITWLPATYLIGQCSFTIFFGQILTIFPSKLVYLFSLFLFALGSLVSGVAPNMAAMLSGRTISGVGAAGIFMAIMQVLIETTTLAGRAMYMGMIGLLMSVTMVIGPIIGGALSDHATWRWCFYLNLPICGLTALAILVLFDVRAPLGSNLSHKVPVLQQLRKLDWIGFILLSGIVCMVLIPMQQVDVNGWVSAATLVPICLSPVVLLVTYLWFRLRERQSQDSARVLLPLRTFRDANFVACMFACFLVFWVVIEYIYLIPLYFETVKGHSALRSGVDMLALVITFGVGSAAGGILIKKTGHYFPQFVLCPLCGIAGSAMMVATTVETSMAYHVGSQILIGIGLGPMVQSPMLALQSNLKDKKLIARAMAFLAFGQRFGGGLGSTLTGAVLPGKLSAEIRQQLRAIPGVDVAQYEHISYNAIRSVPDGPVRDALLRALNNTFAAISIVGIPLFVLLILTVLFFIRVRNINTDKVTSKRHFIRRAVGMQRQVDEEKQDAQPSSAPSGPSSDAKA